MFPTTSRNVYVCEGDEPGVSVSPEHATQKREEEERE